MSLEFKCPSCGKKLFSYETRERKFGEIIKKCQKCGADYADPRYHELAIDGIPDDEFGYLQYVVVIVVGAFFIWRGLHLFSTRQLGVPGELQWLMPSAFIILGIAAIICALVSMISILTGAKRRKFEKMLAESKQRLKNSSYVYNLRKFGYNIPEDPSDGYYQNQS
ncbi:MAG: hypothetical protein K5929_04270 [Lachnospiraceae bacterium]|nr:hypothetical protein [Lachnospiraceae bacterium]